MKTSGSGIKASWFPGIVLGAIAILYSITPIHNGNFFWHLRNGLDIIETGEIRTEDPFSWTRQGVTWIQHEWLAETVMAGSWKAMGSTGAVLVKALFIGLSVFLAFKAGVRNGGSSAFVFVFAAFWLSLAQPRWIARPHFFSIFFFSLYLYLLSRKIDKPLKLALVLFPLQVLWVNIHAGFVMGIFLSSLPAMERVFAGRFRESIPWMCVPVILLGASGIHPNGFRTLEYLPGFLSQPLFKETIREWWSPFDPRYAPLKAVSRTALIFTGLTLGTGLLLLLPRGRKRPGKLFALGILTAATAFASRNGELLAPAMIAWIPGMTAVRISGKALIPLAALLIAIPFTYGVPREIGPPRQIGTGVDWAVYPVELADTLEEHPELLERAVLFNTNEISGYLQYRFGERLPLFIDGRCLLFPESFYREYLNLCFAYSLEYRKYQYELFQKYDFNLLICNTPDQGSSVYLAAMLPQWVPVYSDNLVAAYAGRALLDSAGISDFGYRYFDPYDPSEFTGRQLYAVPIAILEELKLHEERTGSSLYSEYILGLELRTGLSEYPLNQNSEQLTGNTIECWRLCSMNRYDLAETPAARSGDDQLLTAVWLLQGNPLRADQQIMGISRNAMPITAGAEKVLEITALWVAGQQNESLELASASLDSIPGWGIAHCGLLYSLAGDGNRALELAGRALQIRRGPVILEKVARIHYLEGYYSEAAEYCREAISLSPDFTGARLLLGDCLWNMSMVNEAVIEYETIAGAGLQLPEYADKRLELIELINE